MLEVKFKIIIINDTEMHSEDVNLSYLPLREVICEKYRTY